MANKIFLVRKDPMSSRENVEWRQVNGREFYRLTSGKEGERRHFIHLTDDISYEASEIFIEATYEEYRSWRVEEHRHQYLIECMEGTQTLSADVPVSQGEDALIDTVEDDGVPIEEAIEEQDLIERLRVAVRMLQPQERQMIEKLYLQTNPLRQRELAKEMEITPGGLNKQLKKVLEKLRKMISEQ